MKFTISLAALVALGSFTMAAPTPSRDLNDDYYTTCKHDNTPAFNETIFNKVLDTYKSAYGAGGGTLEHGVDGAPTYQGVCCQGLCLYVEHVFEDEDYDWSTLEFQDASERIRAAARGKGTSCRTDVQKEKLSLNFAPDGSRIYIKTGRIKGAWIKLSSEMGDTCSGAKPYRGPVD